MAETPQERLDGLYKRATQGVWCYRRVGSATMEIVSDAAPKCPVIPWTAFDDSNRSVKEHAANAQLLAALQEHWPSLSAELTALKAENERLARELANEKEDSGSFYSYMAAELGKHRCLHDDDAHRDTPPICPPAS